MLSVLCGYVVPLRAQAPAHVAEWWTAQSAPIPGLVGWWRMNEGSGISVADSSAGLTGYLSNSPAWSSGGLSFNNTDTFVELGTNPSWKANTSGTVSVWITPTNLAGQVFGRGGDSAYPGAFVSTLQISVEPSAVRFRIINASGTASLNATTDIPVVSNVVSHLAVTQSGGLKIYINGESRPLTFVAGSSSTGDWFGSFGGTARRWHIGDAPFYTDRYYYSVFKGVIRDVRIYNRALTAAEIARLYNGGIGTHY
jgi:hypothetical protein